MGGSISRGSDLKLFLEVKAQNLEVGTALEKVVHPSYFNVGVSRAYGAEAEDGRRARFLLFLLVFAPSLFAVSTIKIFSN